MESQAAELLRSCDLPPLFIDVLGWERNVRFLPVTVVEIGVPNPRALPFRLMGVAQKRGVQVFLCPPDEYGRVPSQTMRRLIQDQVARAVHHNVVVFRDAARKGQVWHWAERLAGERSMRVYQHRVSDETQATDLLARLTSIKFSIDEEARLTLVDVVRRLRVAFADDHSHIQRGRHGRVGLAAYDLAEMDEGLRFWWEQVLREPHLTREKEFNVACAMQRGDAQALDLMLRAHLHLVARIAWKLVGGHRCPPSDYLDLVQTGNLEMIRLAPGFDPAGGARFQTYLFPRILKTLRRILAGEEGLIPIPRYILETMPGVAEQRAAVEDGLAQRLGRAAYEHEVVEQLAAQYQVPPMNVARVLLIRAGFLSWDVLVAELDTERGHGQDDSGAEEPASSNALIVHDYQSPSDAAVNLVRREQLDAVLGKLTPRERNVIRLRFGLEDGNALTLEEVGQRFAVTRERVRQIELRALKKLRRMGPVDVRQEPTQVQNESKDEENTLIDSDADSAI